MKRLFTYLGKLLKRWERKNTLSKRQIFVIITFVVTGELFLTQIMSPDWRYPFVILLAVSSYILSAFGLRDDLKGIEWFTLLMPLSLYSAAVALFYFLLPVRWLTRIPVAVLYGVGFYAYLLTQNIYNVAANRTIALLRAARSVGFLMTLVTFYLLCTTILSIGLHPLANVLLIGILSYLSMAPALWATRLEGGLGREVGAISIALTGILAQVLWTVSFWPAAASVVALLLSAFYYSLTGMAQEYLSNRLYKKTIYEYVSVIAIVYIVFLLAIRWRTV